MVNADIHSLIFHKGKNECKLYNVSHVRSIAFA